MMEMAWLEDFGALIRAGNFSRAAAARCVTQPAFSRRIRSLGRSRRSTRRSQPFWASLWRGANFPLRPRRRSP